MTINFRNYRNDTRFGNDYHKVCDFLIRINRDKVITPNFLWARWTWMISRPVEDEDLRNMIGIWEDNGMIVALATYELSFGEIHICIDDKYRFLIPEVLSYAEKHLSKDNTLRISIANNDRDIQRLILNNGYYPTQERQNVSILDIKDSMKYSLPEGFKIISMEDEWDFYQYNRVMWRGFNHDGEPEQKDDDIEWRKTMLSSPHLDPKLVLSIIGPDSNFVSHCGLWYMPDSHYAYVEPVATDPDYRKMGLGKACVFEAAIRAGELGARAAYVCSSQQFYYNIGFYPAFTETWWEKIL
ncbi:MAG: GNAT family N-acetyltransferase [Bacillota bacterium]